MRIKSVLRSDIRFRAASMRTERGALNTSATMRAIGTPEGVPYGRQVFSLHVPVFSRCEPSEPCGTVCQEQNRVRALAQPAGRRWN